jgi:hypothetical protein
LNIDGPIEPFLNDLIAKAGGDIDSIYNHCIGYPPRSSGSSGEVVRYLVADNIGYDCHYIGWRGLTVDRILRERDLRTRLETLLDQMGDATLSSI